MLPVAAAAMPTVLVSVSDPEQSHRHSQAEEAEIRSGGSGENTNWV